MTVLRLEKLTREPQTAKERDVLIRWGGGAESSQAKQGHGGRQGLADAAGCHQGGIAL